MPSKWKNKTCEKCIYSDDLVTEARCRRLPPMQNIDLKGLLLNNTYPRIRSDKYNKNLNLLRIIKLNLV